MLVVVFDPASLLPPLLQQLTILGVHCMHLSGGAELTDVMHLKQTSPVMVIVHAKSLPDAGLQSALAACTALQPALVCCTDADEALPPFSPAVCELLEGIWTLPMPLEKLRSRLSKFSLATRPAEVPGSLPAASTAHLARSSVPITGGDPGVDQIGTPVPAKNMEAGPALSSTVDPAAAAAVCSMHTCAAVAGDSTTDSACANDAAAAGAGTDAAASGVGLMQTAVLNQSLLAQYKLQDVLAAAIGGEDGAKAFWLPGGGVVPRVDGRTLSPLQFHRSYVAANTPVILTGLMDDWPAMKEWTDLSYFVRTCGAAQVSVNLTPNGLGDALTPAPPSAGAAPGTQVFVKPFETSMTMAQFIAQLEEGSPGVVPYLSHQNDSLRTELAGIAGCVPASVALAAEAFGNTPDAVNIWIGDERSITTAHKDHYENIYCVVLGEKVFHLSPPCDVLFMYEKVFQQASYKLDGSGKWSIELEDDSVPWLSVDPAQPDLAAHLLYKHASPVECTVGPGEILYLPSMWSHRVSQIGATVAVNYWHDMAFDARFVYNQCMAQLAHMIQAE